MEFLKRDTQFDFLGKRRLAGMISLALIVLGIASLLVRGLNFGIDFTGGTLVEVSYKDSVTVEKVREQLKSARFDDARVQYFGTSRDILVRLPVRSVDNNAGDQQRDHGDTSFAFSGDTCRKSTGRSTAVCVGVGVG